MQRVQNWVQKAANGSTSLSNLFMEGQADRIHPGLKMEYKELCLDIFKYYNTIALNDKKAKYPEGCFLRCQRELGLLPWEYKKIIIKGSNNGEIPAWQHKVTGVIEQAWLYKPETDDNGSVVHRWWKGCLVESIGEQYCDVEPIKEWPILDLAQVT